MPSPFPLIIFILSLLLCSTIILLSAQDDTVESHVPVSVRQDNTRSSNKSEGEENLHTSSTEQIKEINASEQLHDDSLTKLIPHEVLLLLNDTEGKTYLPVEQEDNHTRHDEALDSIDITTLESVYHHGEEIKEVESVPLNTSFIETVDQGSIVIQNDTLRSEEVSCSDMNVSQYRGDEIDEHSIKKIIDDDDADAHKARRVFVDYASKHSGANIIDKSKDFKGTSNLLVDDDDRYAISPCDIGQGSTKYVIIALSEDILVKTIKISSYERYSSQTKQFQILGSQTYPISTKWVDLGTFTAKTWYNTDGQQTFELEQGVWARYLKFRFLTHYGNEHYCTVTQIMVHGQTTLQDFHEVRWDSLEVFDEQSKDATHNLMNNNNSNSWVETNTNITDETPTLSLVDDSMNATIPIIHDLNSTEDLESILTPLPQFLDTNNRGDEASDVTSETIQNPAIPFSIPSATKRSESDSLYTVEFYQNILQMSRNSFPSVYDAAENQCIDATATLATSTKSRAFDTGFRTVVNLTSRLEPSSASPSLINAFSTNKSKVIDAVNSAVMTVVKISPISDAFKSIQRLLNVDLSQESMTPRKRVTQPVLDDIVTNTIAANEVNASFNQTFLDNDRVETDKVNSVIHEPRDDREQLSPIKLKYQFTERKIAECLERLNIQELKVKAGKALKGSASSSNINEPIFKKLADEIKGLQTNQGVYDQFLKSATACYQSVFIEMFNDMIRLESSIDSRFIEMERNLLRKIDSNTDAMSWIEKLLRLYTSLKVFLQNQAYGCCSHFLSGYDEIIKRPRLWHIHSLRRQHDIEHYLLSFLKATLHKHFDVVSFSFGFILAFLILFLLTWKRVKKTLG